jgi:hypothetical protein
MKDVKLNCNLHTFFSTFLASHEYLLGDNDRLVSASPWKKCTAKFVETRDISYIHPVSLDDQRRRSVDHLLKYLVKCAFHFYHL